MRSSISPNAGLVGLVLLVCAATVDAHTWIEEVRRIASNGTFVGTPGYPRNLIPRSNNDVNGLMVYELNGPNVPKSAPMCKSSQTIGAYTPEFPMLKAAPGDNIAMLYEENGHVTLTDAALGANGQPTRPSGNGTVFVYGTKNPSNDDSFAAIHKVWNTDGSGGDKRGKLVATRQFDDGQCYQTNQDPYSAYRKSKIPGSPQELKCQTDIQLPTEAGTSGTYTLYWVWEFPALNKETGAIITNETYTACLDVGMISDPVPAAGAFVADQSAESRAIAAQLKTAFLVNPTATPVLQGSEVPVGQQPTPGSGSTGSNSSAPAPTKAPAAPTDAPSPSASKQPVSAPSSQPAQVVTVTVTETVHDGSSGRAGVSTAASSTQQNTVIVSTTSGAKPSVAAPSQASSPSSGAVFIAPSSISPSGFQTSVVPSSVTQNGANAAATTAAASASSSMTGTDCPASTSTGAHPHRRRAIRRS